MEKKAYNLPGRIITLLLISIFILLSTISLASLGKLRGNARVINYTGIVRGATQRVVKQELAHCENDKLSQRIDGIIQELLEGNGEYNLIPIPDPEFHSLLLQMQDSWKEIKAEILNVRQGAGAKRLYELSEAHFELADRAVSAAEVYSETSVRIAIDWLIGLNGLIIVLGFLFVYYSNKSRKMMAALQAAEFASKEKSRFLSKVSHEMRTPMNGIIGMTSLARLYIGDQEKLKDCLGKIELSSQFLLSLINDTLDMSKIESGKVELVHDDFDLVQLIETIRAMFTQKAEEKGIDFQINFHDLTAGTLIGDSLRVSQIIINLLSNSMKFTPEGGTVTLDVRQTALTEQQADLCFTVSDTGIGMSEEFMDRMFKPFEQADSSISHTYGGTGLGLTICYNLILLMNGTISVKSKKNQGSCFTVNLSFQIPDELSAAEADAAGKGASSTPGTNENPDLTGLCILLAEDNEINSEIATAMLESAGARVNHAWNGKEAVDLFTGSAKGAFDLILMDVQMPTMNGLEAAKKIRESAREDAADIPIIALSANTFKSDVEKALSSGINDYLPKPIDMSQLYNMIYEYCR